MILMALIWGVSINWIIQVTKIHKIKPAIDQATKAAAADVDEVEKARGNLVWDSTKGVASLYKYMRLNMKLDVDDNPLTGSFLHERPIVHVLEQFQRLRIHLFIRKI
jgi:hypothetical protein